MSRLQEIRNELDTDPLGRGYAGMTDQQAADDINLVYREGAADGNLLVQYTLTEVHRTNTNNDTEQLTIWSRMKQLDQAAVGDNTFDMDPGDPNALATRTGIAAADTIIRLLDTDVRELVTNINDARYAALLDALADAHVMKQAQANEMKGFSTNQRSRGQEIGVGRVRTYDITEARAL